MNISLLQYADVSTPVKRFSYNSGNELLLIKPANDEEFYLCSDRYGSAVAIYVVCFDKQGREKWRHNIQNVNRITWLSPMQTKSDKTTRNIVKTTKKAPVNNDKNKIIAPKKQRNINS